VAAIFGAVSRPWSLRSSLTTVPDVARVRVAAAIGSWQEFMEEGSPWAFFDGALIWRYLTLQLVRVSTIFVVLGAILGRFYGQLHP